MLHYLFDLMKRAPIELVLCLFVSGVLSAPGDLTPTERYLVGALILGTIAGILRAIFYFGVDADRDEWNDSGVDFSMSHNDEVSPWGIVQEQLQAALEPVPDTPYINPRALHYMLESLTRQAHMLETMQCALVHAQTLPGHDHKLLPELCARLSSISNSTSVAVHKMAPIVAVLTRLETVPGGPEWCGTPLKDSGEAAVLLMDVTELEWNMHAFTAACGLPAETAFMQRCQHVDDLRTEYGLIQVNDITGTWPPITTVDYYKVLTMQAVFHGSDRGED
jgi:hypothetical protein